MLKQYAGSLSSEHSGADMAALASPRSEPLPRDDFGEIGEDSGAMAQTVRDQLAREVADIEALESWTKAPANTGGKPRPVWLLIGVLWLSTALVTAGAVVAIATLVG
jgi:hypothetical protein